MITLLPISKNIQNTLFQKMAMLSAGGNRTVSINEDGKWVPSNQIINKELTKDGKLVQNFMHTRTVWMRMTSFTPRAGTKNTAVIIMGGELSSLGRLRSGFADREAPVNVEISSDGKLNYQGLYELDGEIPFRPGAGVKDISVDYKGGGMKLGATRTADISWTCWNFEQLEHFTPHFLQHGKTILLEWGWGGIGSLALEQVYPLFNEGTLNYNDDRIIDLNTKILSHIQSQNGHYDAMLGLVQKFDWSVNDDGGFNCSTAIISPGITLFQNKQKKLKANQFATLPAITQNKDFGQKGFFWLTDDLREVLKPDMDSVAALAPYITFQEYMKDFGQQIAFQLHSRGCKQSNWKENVADKVAHQILAPYGLHAYDSYLKADPNGGVESIGYKIKPGGGLNGEVMYMDNRRLVSNTYDMQKKRIEKGGFLNPSKGTDDTETPDVNEAFNSYSNGAGFFVTWGWFEDNVLSRFFGNVTETDPDIKGDPVIKKVVGEFRSIERDVDDEGKFLVDGDKNPLYQNIKFKNSRYLMTTDMSKWIIPNLYDPVFGSASSSLVSAWAWTTIEHMKLKNPDIFLDETSAEIRKIFFNVKYLSNKLEDSTDILESIGAIWNDFSSEYGGIYRFKIEYDDVGSTLCIREEGFTHPGKSVKEQIEQQEKIARGETSDKANAFMFPSWEQNSIVKSQTINAKLPARMQMAAMYGLNVQKEKTEKGSERDIGSTNTYDDISAKAWGRFARPIAGTEGMTPEEIKRKSYTDRITGDIDYPSRGNRYFGRYDADIQKPLLIGPRDANNTGKWNSPGVVNDGTIIGDTIKYSLEEGGKSKVLEERNDLTPTGPTDSATQNILKAGYSNFLRQMDVGNTEQSLNFNRMFYTLIEGPMVGSYFAYHRRLKTEILFQLQSLLRGHGDGVLNNTDPLIPIDFEMEIDGTGGLFPGNSFQTSYLPKRYRKESIFQATGVSHKISNTEWTTTIKGQIRAMSSKVTDQREEEADLALTEYQEPPDDTPSTVLSATAKYGNVAKGMNLCIPKRTKIDTPNGRIFIENLKAGDEVIGYNGNPVFITQKHEYKENPELIRFLKIFFDDGKIVDLCDMHRLVDKRSKEYNVGDIVNGNRIVDIKWYGGVEKSYDLLTEDKGYRMSGIPVNSMIIELMALETALRFKDNEFQNLANNQG